MRPHLNLIENVECLFKNLFSLKSSCGFMSAVFTRPPLCRGFVASHWVFAVLSASVPMSVIQGEVRASRRQAQHSTSSLSSLGSDERLQFHGITHLRLPGTTTFLKTDSFISIFCLMPKEGVLDILFYHVFSTTHDVCGKTEKEENVRVFTSFGEHSISGV